MEIYHPELQSRKGFSKSDGLTEGEKYSFSSVSETIINLHHLLWYVTVFTE